MQKKLIAVALAGLASSAVFADTNVTVYGVADAYAFHSKGSNNARGDVYTSGLNGGGLSGSRIGFTGTEDLGSGLKAVFRFELGTVAIDAGNANNNGIDNTRQSYVGLAGGFGTIIGGRLQSIGYDFSTKYDALPGYVFSPLGQLTDNAGFSISARDASARVNNTVGYVSPALGPVTLKATYSFGEQNANTAATRSAQHILGLGADADIGPVSFGVVLHRLTDVGGKPITNTGAAIEQDQTEIAAGVKYDLGVLKLIGTYERRKDQSSNQAKELKETVLNAGISVPFGTMSALNVGYARYKQGDRSFQKAKSFGVEYEQYLSKRTTAYAGYSFLRDSDGAAFSLLNTGTTVGADGKTSQVAAGLRHVF